MADDQPKTPPPPAGIPPERLRALVRLLGPGEMTPTAKRYLELLCQEYER